MSTVTKNALKGYAFQWTIIEFFCYFLELYSNDFTMLECEIGGDDEHKFDDFKLSSKKETIYFQTKNYKDGEIKVAEVEGDEVVYSSSRSKLSKSGLNVFVCRAKRPDEVSTNNNFYGIPSIFYSENNLHIIYMTVDDIENYLNERCINNERIIQLHHFFNQFLLSNLDLKINASDLPNAKIYSNDLDTETMPIRDPIRCFETGLTIILAPPGYGKSHYVSEIGLSDNMIYRFWSKQDDTDIKERLSFDNFLCQLSIKLFSEKQKRTAEEIINRLGGLNSVFAIDGLDHVYNYYHVDFEKYLDFFNKISKSSKCRVVVLSREIPGNHFDNYKIVHLKGWTKQETKKYLNNLNINNSAAIDKIFEIANGYPIITYYLAKEYIDSGSIRETNKISSVDEYYKELLSKDDYQTTISSLSLMCYVYPFIHEKDITLFWGEEIQKTIVGISKMYPYLLRHINGRFYFYHDSLYNFISNACNEIDNGKNRIKGIIYNSLFNGDVNFMSRFSPFLFEERETKTLIKKYCDIKFFLSLFSKTFDYESIQDIYNSIFKIIVTKNEAYLSVKEIYSLVTILLILVRNYYHDNTNLSIQIFNQITLVGGDDWANYVFSNKDLYNNLDKLTDLSKKEKTKFGFYRYDMIGSNIEAEFSNEQYFFDVLTNNICEPLNEELKKEKYLHYNLFGEYLVSAYIHGPNKDSIKQLIQYYNSSDNVYELRRRAAEYLPFVSYSTDLSQISFAFSKATSRLKALGIIDNLCDYCTLSSAINAHKDYNSFDMVDIVNGYLRLANRNNRKIDLTELSSYLTMMDAYKDTSIIYLPEALSFFVKKGLFTIKQCYIWIKKVYLLKDSGNSGFATDFVNSLGEDYVDELVDLHFFDNNDFYVRIYNLSISIINKLNISFIYNYISDLVRKDNYKDYISDERLGNILLSKYNYKVRRYLKIDGIAIKKSLSTSKRRMKKPKVEELRDGFYKPEYKEYYQEYGFSITEMAELKDGYGYKLPSPNVFDIFDAKNVEKNITKIIFWGFTRGGEIFNKYNQYNAPLIYSIPALCEKYNKKISLLSYSKSLKIFIDTILLC